MAGSLSDDTSTAADRLVIPPMRPRERIAELLLQSSEAPVSPVLLCQVATDVTGTTGAGIALIGQSVPQSLAGASDTVAARIEELQFTLGEGPCIDAYRWDTPVGEPNLADPSVLRWPAYSPAAIDAGVRAVFAFPLRTGGIRLGALSLYMDEPGQMSDDQHHHAVVMAEVTAEALILMQTKAPLGKLAAELALGADTRAVVHQAAGMMAGQMAVSVADALVQLRAYAFATNRRPVAVAQDVVDRHLSFYTEDQR